MSYYLRIEHKQKGDYLQMYDRHWDKERKQARSKSIRAFGYVNELIARGITDPVAYYRKYVAEENAKRAGEQAEKSRERAFHSHVEKYAGHFLVQSLIEELGVKQYIDILASTRQFRFSIYEMLSQLVCARIICPCSKSQTVSSVFPLMYKGIVLSEDQVYDGLNFIGSSYSKYIELFNICYEKYYKRNYGKLYFDCTNYYFEIDVPSEDKQKGVSKDNKTEPIIGQALLLDGDLVPLAMKMYPGNESEKPYIRNIIEDMKQRYRVSGKTIQVADKGLNCARNIYAAVKEARDGYIFSKSIHGRGLSEAEKEWILLENETNVYEEKKDASGKVIYRLKSCVDTFNYSFKEDNPQTGEREEIKFSVKEKRVVSYNPALAEKQRAEIMKMVQKATNCLTYKKLMREELGETTKYVKVTSQDCSGKTVRPTFALNQEKIDEDMKLAGYNLLVTSEVEMSAAEIYRAYHDLWKIEESFRITKSYLDARPVYVQKRETIYGHFLVCYLSLFLLRIMEIKCFKGAVNAYDLIGFMRDFRMVDAGDGTYINISNNEKLNTKIKAVTGLTILDVLRLTEDEIDDLFKYTCLVGS